MRCLMMIKHPDLQYPCGRCDTCKMRRANSRAAQQLLEYYDCGQRAVFVTLTYSDATIPLTRRTAEPVVVWHEAELKRLKLIQSVSGYKPRRIKEYSELAARSKSRWLNRCEERFFEDVANDIRRKFDLGELTMAHHVDIAKRVSRKMAQIEERPPLAVVYGQKGGGAPTLDPRQGTLFVDRLRDRADKQRVASDLAYFVIGEYGPSTERPHMHANIFMRESGLPDVGPVLKKVFGRLTEEAWRIRKGFPRGHIQCDPFNQKRAHYVASYIAGKFPTAISCQGLHSAKRMRVDGSADLFSRMSKNPALGDPYIAKLIPKLREAAMFAKGLSATEFDTVLQSVEGSMSKVETDKIMAANKWLTLDLVEMISTLKNVAYGRMKIYTGDRPEDMKASHYLLPYRQRRKILDALGVQDHERQRLKILDLQIKQTIESELGPRELERRSEEYDRKTQEAGRRFRYNREQRSGHGV